MDFTDVIHKRRMVRNFTAAPVPPESLNRILDATRRGPSAGFTQGQDFIVVTEGLAAGFAGVHDLAALRALLNIPTEVTPVGVIPIGHPAPDKRSPSLKRGRRPQRDVVHQEKW
jgi:nitroreductase